MIVSMAKRDLNRSPMMIAAVSKRRSLRTLRKRADVAENGRLDEGRITHKHLDVDHCPMRLERCVAVTCKLGYIRVRLFAMTNLVQWRRRCRKKVAARLADVMNDRRF